MTVKNTATDGAPCFDTPFGLTHVIEPESRHTHTVVLLHGRGSTGKEFADELFDTTLSGSKTLKQLLPGWRWVFPSSQRLWSATFQQDLPAWFEAHSLTDVTVRQDLQTGGIEESVHYLSSILVEEIERLDGHAENLVLGGISQGAAIGIWTLLYMAEHKWRLGGFVGASSWLPFAVDIKELFYPFDEFISGPPDDEDSGTPHEFVVRMLGGPRQNSPYFPEPLHALLDMPTFLGHGTDDAYVDISLGRQARDVLRCFGMTVEWKEYSGAEQEGHWLKEPEEIDDIASFFLLISSS